MTWKLGGAALLIVAIAVAWKRGFESWASAYADWHDA